MSLEGLLVQVVAQVKWGMRVCHNLASAKCIARISWWYRGRLRLLGKGRRRRKELECKINSSAALTSWQHLELRKPFTALGSIQNRCLFHL